MQKPATFEQRQRVAALLMDVVSGQVTSQAALSRAEKWNDIPWDKKPFEGIYHALQHYEIDQDIRAEDESYGNAQRAALRRHADDLLSKPLG